MNKNENGVDKRTTIWYNHNRKQANVNELKMQLTRVQQCGIMEIGNNGGEEGWQFIDVGTAIACVVLG